MRLPDFEAWAIFGKVAQLGSFGRAATELGLSKATVSKAVSRLERRIGASLFHRTSRKMTLTEAGRSAALSAERIVTEAEAAEALALDSSETPRGLVRLAAPMSFGATHVAPILPEFLTLNPEVAIDLHLSDELIDLVAAGFDCVLRISALIDSTLRARHICEVRRAVVGAPAYFDRRGRPAHPSELADHACLGYAYLPKNDQWRFRHASGEEVAIVPRGPLRANNADALQPALLAGLGVAVQPEFTVWDDLEQGRLQRVLADWRLPPIGLNIVMPPGPLRPARVRVLIDFLERKLATAAWAR